MTEAFSFTSQAAIVGDMRLPLIAALIFISTGNVASLASGRADQVTRNGLACLFTRASGGTVTCRASDGQGDVFSMTRGHVAVRNARGKTVFSKANPTTMPESDFLPKNDPRVKSRVSNFGMACYWGRLIGNESGVWCDRADDVGDVVFLSRSQLLITDPAGNTRQILQNA
jgi:hypothetical protein